MYGRQATFNEGFLVASSGDCVACNQLNPSEVEDREAAIHIITRRPTDEYFHKLAIERKKGALVLKGRLKCSALDPLLAPAGRSSR